MVAFDDVDFNGWGGGGNGHGGGKGDGSEHDFLG